MPKYLSKLYCKLILIINDMINPAQLASPQPQYQLTPNFVTTIDRKSVV